MFGAETGLSSQRTCFPWIRGCVWPCGLARNFGDVRGGSPDHHGTRHAHDAARRRAEVWDRAPSGAAKRANRTAPGTPHRTHRAAPRAAHRTRRATGRTRRHHHRHRDRAEKVICHPASTTATVRLKAGRRMAVQHAATAGLQDSGQAAPAHRQARPQPARRHRKRPDQTTIRRSADGRIGTTARPMAPRSCRVITGTGVPDRSNPDILGRGSPTPDVGSSVR